MLRDQIKRRTDLHINAITKKSSSLRFVGRFVDVLLARKCFGIFESMPLDNVGFWSNNLIRPKKTKLILLLGAGSHNIELLCYDEHWN